MGVHELTYWAETFCGYEANTISRHLMLTHNTTFYLSVALYAIGLVMHELYLFFLGFGMTLNSLLNLLLKWAFMHAVPVTSCGMDHRYCVPHDAPWVLPPNGTALEPANACGIPPWPAYDPTSGANCGAPPLDPCVPCASCGMPSFEAQDTAFFVTMLLLYMFTWRHPNVTFFHNVVLVAWLAGFTYIHAAVQFNSPAQIIAGASAGAAFAMFWHCVVFSLVYPYFDVILRWRIVRYLNYRDTFCRANAPVPGDPVSWK